MDTRKRPVLRVLNTLMACLGVAAGGLVICGLLLAYVPPPAAPAAGTADPEPSAVEEPTPQAEESTAPEASDEEPEEAAPAKMTRRDTYDEAGGLLWSHVYQYDDQGRMNGVTSYNAAGEQTGFVEILYDAYGRQLQAYSWTEGASEDGGKVDPIVYRYDASGKLEREELYHEGELDLYIVCQYDQTERAIRTDSYFPDGTLMSYSLNQYDGSGRITRVDSYSPAGDLETYAVWTYDADRERVAGYASYYADGTECLRWTYTYDEAGNLVREELRDSGTTTVAHIQYE